MDPTAQPSALPALRRDAAGQARVDLRAVAALALPLFVNSSLQAVLNLTDTWFLGRISTSALAAVSAVFWPVIVVNLLLGGVSMGVQTVVAQAYGAGARQRAGAAVRSGVWAALLTVPLFVGLAFAGRPLIGMFALGPDVAALAYEYWFPRLLGGPAGLAAWALTGFFNGIGRTRVTLAISIVAALVNALFNQVFIFGLGLGVAGSAWATTSALLVNFGMALWLFRLPSLARDFGSGWGPWRPDGAGILRLVRFGSPIGLLPAVDLLAMAVFQLMQVRLGTVEGAATQIVIQLTSICFFPAIGIALAGTTLVGQSIGAGSRDWATRVGNTCIALAAAYMGSVCLLLAAAGPWLMPWFVGAGDANAGDVVALGVRLLWLAALFQFFDGLNIGSSFCLRGAGDVRIPTIYLLVIAWLGFVPLAHALTFPPGGGFVAFLPALGQGVVGGWLALVAYVVVLGTALLLRWRSGAWQRIGPIRA